MLVVINKNKANFIYDNCARKESKKDWLFSHSILYLVNRNKKTNQSIFSLGNKNGGVDGEDALGNTKGIGLINHFKFTKSNELELVV